MSEQPIRIVDACTGVFVAAAFQLNFDKRSLLAVELDWQPMRYQLLRRMLESGVTDMPEHHHWNWARKTVQRDGYFACGITVESQTQGLIMLNSNNYFSRLDSDRTKPLMYVSYIETAPWNARQYTDAPRFKGIGVKLMHLAIRMSREYGFDGRVGLHSLPQTIGFYSRTCKMEAFGQDSNCENLEYFEMTTTSAMSFLNE